MLHTFTLFLMFLCSIIGISSRNFGINFKFANGISKYLSYNMFSAFRFELADCFFALFTRTEGCHNTGAVFAQGFTGLFKVNPAGISCVKGKPDWKSFKL